MKAHVTCGRGTEPFAKAELQDKLRCNVSSVEDGKVFFSLGHGDVPETAGVLGKDHRQLFHLKTVERLFATVTHFPTSDIKGNGKVRFLRALKDRILNGTSLKEAVKNTQKLRLLQKSCTEHHQQVLICSPTKCGENGASPHKSLVLSKCSLQTECKTAVENECSASVKEVCENLKCAGEHLLQENLPGSHISSSEVDKNHYNAHCNNPYTQDMVREVQSERRDSSANSSTCSHCGNGHKLQIQNIINHTHRKRKGQTTHLVSVSYSECLTEPPAKLGRYDSMHSSFNNNDRDTAVNTDESCLAETSKQENSLPDQGKEEASVSFRFSVKCGGWCKKWLQPQRLAKELAVRLTVKTGWAVDLSSPDIEICVHINDDFVTAGIPLTKLPLSKRDYIQDAGLRSTISWIMARQAGIQPGHCVLDPMCGKATILVEAAREHPHVTGVVGCDMDPHQLQAADRNTKHARLCQPVQLIQADALNLPLRNGSVDRIVCDAPFGNKFIVTSCALPHFYKCMMQEMHRVLAPEGLTVLLTSQELLPVVQENCHTALRWEPTIHPDAVTIPGQNSTCHGPNKSQEYAQGENLSVPAVWGSRVSAVLDVEGTATAQQLSVHTSSNHQPACDKSLTDLIEQSPVCDPKLKSADEQLSEKDICPVQFVFSNQGTAKRNIDSTDTFKRKQTVAELESENGQFSLISQHYVKLGETHAYIVVLQKSML